MAPAGSLSHGPLVYLNSSCLLNLQCPIHSAAASLSEEGMSETPRCLTLHKLTEVPLPSVPSPPLSSSPVFSGPRKHPLSCKGEILGQWWKGKIWQSNGQIWCCIFIFFKGNKIVLLLLKTLHSTIKNEIWEFVALQQNKYKLNKCVFYIFQEHEI